MPETLPNPEQNNPYQITDQVSELALQIHNDFSFVANPENFSIIIGDAHNLIINRNNLDERDYIGGRVWLNKDKISFTSGSLKSDEGLDEMNRNLLIQALKSWARSHSK